MLNTQSCSVQQRISQATVLAMLKAPSTLGIKPGQQVQYIDEKGRTYQLRVVSVGQTTAVLATTDGTIVVDKSKLKTNATPVFLDKIPLNQWSITSFDPTSRIVCVAITTPFGVRNVTVTLPILVNKTPGP